MKSLGVFEAKTHFSALIDAAIAGESTLITKHGKPVAELVPAGDPQRVRARLAASRIRAMRATVAPAPGETIRELIDDGTERP
jgi:prevent-host-death family protein